MTGNSQSGRLSGHGPDVARPGYGSRHPELLATLEPLSAAHVERVEWPGKIRLDVAAYAVVTQLPDLLVTSVRCIVWVGDRLFVCRTPDGPHIMPGGRREAGETYQSTACREVREETGWVVDESSLRPIGFLHYRFLDPLPLDHPYPHPDILQSVFTTQATKHCGGIPTTWVDTEGWEQEHQLLTLPQLEDASIPRFQLSFVGRSLAALSDE